MDTAASRRVMRGRDSGGVPRRHRDRPRRLGRMADGHAALCGPTMWAGGRAAPTGTGSATHRFRRSPSSRRPATSSSVPATRGASRATAAATTSAPAAPAGRLEQIRDGSAAGRGRGASARQARSSRRGRRSRRRTDRRPRAARGPCAGHPEHRRSPRRSRELPTRRTPRASMRSPSSPSAGRLVRRRRRTTFWTIVSSHSRGRRGWLPRSSARNASRNASCAASSASAWFPRSRRASLRTAAA